MCKQITITLPTPPSELNPNSTRPHWRYKAKATKHYRKRSADEAAIGVYQLEDQEGFPLKRAVIQVTYYHPTKAFKDPDNILASLKAAFDGLVDGGILADDRDVTYPPVKRFKDADCPRVELAITEEN